MIRRPTGTSATRFQARRTWLAAGSTFRAPRGRAEPIVRWCARLGCTTSPRPEWTEHFGIVTVEAIAAGCVPVVIRKGGQPEIVEHGASGFLWDTLGELKEYTRLLA